MSLRTKQKRIQIWNLIDKKAVCILESGFIFKYLLTWQEEKTFLYFPQNSIFCLLSSFLHNSIYQIADPLISRMILLKRVWSRFVPGQEFFFVPGQRDNRTSGLLEILILCGKW